MRPSTIFRARQRLPARAGKSIAWTPIKTEPGSTRPRSKKPTAPVLLPGEPQIVEKDIRKALDWLQDLRKSVRKVEDKISQHYIDANAANNKFFAKMKKVHDLEPQPKDFGLPADWKPPGGSMGVYTEMNEWRSSDAPTNLWTLLDEHQKEETKRKRSP